MQVEQVFKIGIGGPVGSGKTALIEALVPILTGRGHSPGVITNDIYTQEDAEHVRRTLAGTMTANASPASRQGHARTPQSATTPR